MTVKGLSTEQRPLYFRNKETGEMCTGGFLAKHIDRWQPLYSEPIKERISEPVENLEPVAWLYPDKKVDVIVPSKLPWFDKPIPLYTAPPKREWAGLTEEEKAEIFQSDWNLSYEMIDMAEAKLKEKNT